MRRVTGNDDAFGARPLQPAHTLAQRRERQFAAALENRRDPIGHPRVGDHDQGQIILITLVSA